MGGTIWCANREGGGSEFGFTLPLMGDAEFAATHEPVLAPTV